MPERFEKDLPRPEQPGAEGAFIHTKPALHVVYQKFQLLKSNIVEAGRQRLDYEQREAR